MCYCFSFVNSENSIFSTRYDVLYFALCCFSVMAGQIKTLRDELTAERPQLVCESTVVQNSNAVDIPTTLGLDSLPSHGGTSISLCTMVVVLAFL